MTPEDQATKRLNAKLQAVTTVVGLLCATAATFTNHLSSDAYTAVLGASLGYSFGNFRHMVSKRATDTATGE